MRAVVTGATGFLGSALVEQLLAGGHTVLALGRDPDAMGPRVPPGVACGFFDLQKPQVPSGLRAGDVVFHCAALLGNAKADRQAYLRANTESVQVLALAARDAGAALFQFISSVSANGPEGRADHPLHEGSPFRPASLYGESKALAEQALSRLDGLRVQVLRPPVIYGPGANSHSSASKIFRLMRGSLFFRRGTGDNHFNVISREELVRAMLWLAQRALEGNGSAPGGSAALPPNPDTWMVRDDPCPTMAEMQAWIAQAYGRRPLILALPWPLLAGLGAVGDILRAWGLSFPLSREIARGFGTSGYFSSVDRLKEAGWQPSGDSREAVGRTALTYARSSPGQ
jgi:nucleoside-diphosphate-sugar epimerase